MLIKEKIYKKLNLSPIRMGLVFQGVVREICVSQMYFAKIKHGFATNKSNKLNS